MNNFWFVILALAAGMMMPTQAAINNKLAGHVGNPILAALISFAVGTVALFFYVLATGIPVSDIAKATGAPPIAWLGGILGAFFVASAVVLVSKIDVALAFSLIVAGQMLITLVIDHFGLFGVAEKSISPLRVVGAALITIGVVLIRKF
jgi:transporter family-2 protein